MTTWRCPHCATLQVDSRRCFLCDRSATSCGTCVNFRRSLVGGVGYCALDRRREPLTGAEQRTCWSAGAHTSGDGLLAGSEELLTAGDGLPGSGVPESGAVAPPARRTRGGLIEVGGA
jgi:hypothetical protein